MNRVKLIGKIARQKWLWNRLLPKLHLDQKTVRDDIWQPALLRFCLHLYRGEVLRRLMKRFLRVDLALPFIHVLGDHVHVRVLAGALFAFDLIELRG